MSAEKQASAFLFPGQGSQYVGMGRSAHARYPEVRRLWERADAALGLPLTRLVFEGPESELQRTENTQPALLVASVAAYQTVTLHNGLPRPDYMAGHSLGEYSALVAANSIEFEDAVRLVRRRGELMAEQGQLTGGTMAAVIGMDVEAVRAICTAHGVDVANFNSPEQTVVSGPAEAVRAAGEAARARGAKRVIALNVSGAFHSRLMRPAAEAFERAVNAVQLSPPSTPVLGNVDVELLTTETQVRAELVSQLYSPVLWTQILVRLASLGVREYLEVGPGKVLTGLVRRVAPDASARTTDSMLEAA